MEIKLLCWIDYVKEQSNRVIYLKHPLAQRQNMVLNNQYESKYLKLVELFVFLLLVPSFKNYFTKDYIK